MAGKIIAVVILLLAVITGAGVYYFQVYGYYYAVTPTPGQDVQIVQQDNLERTPIPYTDFQAIDADSSPIRYRSCFQTTLSLDELSETYVIQEGGEPRVAPGWFDCFDAEAIGEGIETGDLTVFLSQKNISFGVDRVVAIGRDGKGWAWHELNECGHKAYDGTVVGEICPERPANE